MCGFIGVGRHSWKCCHGHEHPSVPRERDPFILLTLRGSGNRILLEPQLLWITAMQDTQGRWSLIELGENCH